VSQQTPLKDNDKIALALRLRRILILTLLDYFNGSTYFNNLVIKELNELFEGIVKIMARNLGIPLTDSNGKRRGLNEIINGVSNAVPHVKEVLIKIFNYFSQPLPFHNYQITIRDLRNAEAHGINIPILPFEAIVDTWRIINEFINTIDPTFSDFLYSRNELREVYHMYQFLKMALLDDHGDIYLDFSKLKEEERVYPFSSPHIKVSTRKRTVTILLERNAWEIIKLIGKGGYQQALTQR
jgi:hypothetical protein